MTADWLRAIRDKKGRGERLTMVTAYDHCLAALVDACGLDMILVGDSAANVVYGMASTRDIDCGTMLRHAAAVRRAARRTPVVADMPFTAYQVPGVDALANARRFIDEAGCDAVKLEWCPDCPALVGRIAAEGIPVMGHIGLTPQSIEGPDGFKVRGRTAESAEGLMDQARRLEGAGCFSLVLECVPAAVGEAAARALRIPVIGIGAGPACDGQVLVLHDLLGLTPDPRPRFVGRFGRLGEAVEDAVRRFREEVLAGRFPGPEHAYGMNPEEQARFTKRGGS